VGEIRVRRRAVAQRGAGVRLALIGHRYRHRQTEAQSARCFGRSPRRQLDHPAYGGTGLGLSMFRRLAN